MEKFFNLRMQKKIIIIILIMIAIFSTLGAVFLKPVYVVKIDEEVIGFVEEKSIAEKALQEIEKNLEGALKKEVIFPQEIMVEKAYNSNIDKVDTIDEIREKMKEHLDISIEAYALNVEGKDLAYLNSKKEANDILNILKENYHSKDQKNKLKEIGFVEDVKIQQRWVLIEKIQKKEEIVKYILQGKNKIYTYTLKEGDTIWDIMKEYGLALEEIEKSNPNIDLEKVKTGQKISLILSQPCINVKEVVIVSHQENIPFEIQYKTSNTLYKGDTKVVKEGIEGKKRIYTEVEKINGIEQQRKVMKEEILKEPVMKIVERGIKERPKTMATGDLIIPARGRISSNFGSRWGRVHEGIDFAMPVGTDVKAADGGKVIFSGVQNGYGNIVIINHENGYETRYAHNSKLLVQVGDRVYKGQSIAKSGNTGRSTGPHLHFEVRKNRVPVDPKRYINEFS